MYDISEIYEPKTIKEAISLLNDHPDAHILAGGSDLFIKLREGKLADIKCISIFKVEELRGVEILENGSILIKPLTSFSHITNHPIIKENINVLGEAVDTIGGPQIRNIGTIGGNICNGVTSADSASTLFALDAQLQITSLQGTRTLPIAEFYLGPGKVDLRQGEMLTGICISNYTGYHGCYTKYAMRNAMDIATLGCAINVRLALNKKTIDDIKIAFGVAAPTPMRCKQTEALLIGKPLDSSLYDEIAQGVVSEISPRSSWRASKELRLQIAKEIAVRGFREGVLRCGGVI